MTVYVHLNLDWARAPERKSASGGMMMVSGKVVKHWSRTQASRALSTADADSFAVVTGAAEGLGMQSMWTEFAGSCLDRLQRS